MTNKQYLAALKKALAGMNKQTKEEILQEIQSHAQESDTLLIDRFGSVESLASQYLEGETLQVPATKKVARAGKKILLWIAGAIVLFFIVVGIIGWVASWDDFDYSNETAAEIDKNDGSWQELDWDKALELKVKQAQVIAYFHDENTILWRCADYDGIVEQEAGLIVERNKCFFFLPPQTSVMNVAQSEVVLIKPQMSLDISVYQASLKIAENGNTYQYNFDKKDSSVDNFKSDASAQYTLNIKSEESRVQHYIYD